MKVYQLLLSCAQQNKNKKNSPPSPEENFARLKKFLKWRSGAQIVLSPPSPPPSKKKLWLAQESFKIVLLHANCITSPPQRKLL